MEFADLSSRNTYPLARRTFMAMIAGGLLAAPLAATAQPAGKVYRIGMLETRSAELNAANIDAFRQGLREFGYVEGQNLVIECRGAAAHDAGQSARPKK